MISAALFKAVAAVVLLIIALVGASGPLLLVRYGREGGQGQRSLAFVLGNMLSAGVMVSAGFVHLLGAAIVEMGALHARDFPWAPFLCACGFLVTLLADQLATGVSGHGHSHGHGTITPRGSTPVHGVALGSNGIGLGAEGQLVHQLARSAGSGSAGREHSTELVLQRPDSSQAAEAQAPRALSVPQRKHVADSNGYAAATDSANEEDRGLLPHAAPHSDGTGWEWPAALTTDQDSPKKRHRPSSAAEQLPAVSFLTAVLMAVALCFHSVLEGAAIGAQENTVDTAHIFIAIAAHKGLAAYALGSSLVDSLATTGRFWSVIGTFALATPLGIGLGMLLSSLATGRVAAGISALASGTFLYVAFMEIIPRELEDPRHRASKLGVLAAGFAAMSLLAVWA